MAKCRIKNIKPPCGYTVEGLAKIWLLDFEDFRGFRFDGNDLYSNCLVTDILRVGDFIELAAPDLVAKYSSSGSYVHNLESFVGTLDASTISNLHLATKGRYVVLFRGNNGNYYTFGYEAGAAVTYLNQTAEGFGSLVTVNAPSRFPLFEVTPDAVNRFVTAYTFNPDFDNNAYCETI